MGSKREICKNDFVANKLDSVFKICLPIPEGNVRIKVKEENLISPPLIGKQKTFRFYNQISFVSSLKKTPDEPQFTRKKQPTTVTYNDGFNTC